MGCINKATTLLLIAITAVLVLFLIQSTQAEIENIGTSCSIIVDDVVEGQPITITVQIFPAPPLGEVFSNVSVGIVSPLQGISGNGPWDQKNICTDSNGVAKVTFYIPTFGSPTNWNVWVYFGGQYLANNTLYYQASHLESKFYISAAQTPTPKPTPFLTLGPVQIRSAGSGGTNVQIISPQNKSTARNPIQLVFCVKASLLPFCYTSVGNIGYSVDGGTINSVNNFINQTIIHGASDDATVWANVTFPSLSEGPHYVTVYFGWQFSGINQRYEVSAYSNVDFSISSKTPTPYLSPTSTTTPTSTITSKPVSSNYLSSPIFLIVIFSLVTVFSGLLVYFKKRKR